MTTLPRKSILITLCAALLLVPGASLADLGVGVGTGRITFDEQLRPGAVYNLPSVSVVNTGDVASEYGVEVTFHADHEGSWPDADWISFQPERFYLEPGESQAVAVTLRLPVRTSPGDYFAFLEAYPVVEEAGPGAAVGIAAAARLEFSVMPANIWQGLYFRFISFMTENAPWTYVVMAVLVLAFVITFFRKFFFINIGRR